MIECQLQENLVCIAIRFMEILQSKKFKLIFLLLLTKHANTNFEQVLQNKIMARFCISS